ncbi:MAG: CCA tRNA nucleotidyltransferase [Lachnospiraceae bacterium]|nr:CCA tRNA nucleotidyltransferase [Lachnospiraceae bacterium]
MEIKLPQAVEEIIGQINDAGYEAYIVGGCVRDTLLHKEPNDWDITTSATPVQVKAIFKRTIDTGIQHGTVTVMKRRQGYEVTTYRIDGTYEDARHPKEVIFTPDLREDLKRRDFTINAMAYHPESGLVDPFDGRKDLEAHVIRCVGDPRERFSEDALRMMRAVRFAAQLDYKIEECTWEAIKELAPSIGKISAERIQTEMVKLLLSDHPEQFWSFYQCGLTAYFLPEFDRMAATVQNNPHHCYTVGEHTMHGLSYIKAEQSLRLAMLLHDIAKPVTKTTDEKGVDHFWGHPERGSKMAEEILRRLKFDNHTIAMVKGLVAYHDRRIEPVERAMRKALHQIGEEYFPALFEVREADVMAQSEYQKKEKLDAIREGLRIYQKIKEEGQCISLKSLAVNGGDLIRAGIEPGQAIGVILEQMLQDVIGEPSHNTKEYLIQRYVP